MSASFARVEVYGHGDAAGMVVAVFSSERARSTAEMQDLAAATGLARAVFTGPPRREDCELRARTFTPSRELPRSVEAALALAALRGAALTLEEGVTATRAEPLGGGLARVETPAPVLGTQDLDDPELAAAALGIALADLDPARPPRAASCGPNVMVIPLASAAALRAARLDPEPWRRTVGKARHHGALALFVEPGGVVLARSLTADPALPEERGNGLSAAAALGYLEAFDGAVGALTFVFGGGADGPAALTASRRSGENPWISARVRGLNA